MARVGRWGVRGLVIGLLVACALGALAVALLLRPADRTETVGDVQVQPTGGVSTSGPTRGAPTSTPASSGPSTQPPVTLNTVPVIQGSGGGRGDLDAAVAKFQESCDNSVSNWHVGRVDYPATLPMQLHESVTYNAAVDINQTPVPPEKVISAGSAKSEAVTVKCVVGARLVLVGDGLSVAPEEDASDGGWRYRQFSPTGVLEWAWTVTADAPYDWELRLELRPAVEGTSVLEAAQDQAAFTTDVSVAASAPARFGYWFKQQWAPLFAVLGAIGTVVVAILGFIGALPALRRRPEHLPSTPHHATLGPDHPPPEQAGHVGGTHRRPD